MSLLNDIKSELHVDTLAPRAFYNMLWVLENTNPGYRERDLISKWFNDYKEMTPDEQGKFVSQLSNL